jgi:hypothetical protein
MSRAFSLPRGLLLVTADVFDVVNWANHSEYQSKQNLLDLAEPLGGRDRQRRA